MSATAILRRWADVLDRNPSAFAVLAPDGETLRTFADIEAEASAFSAFDPGAVVAMQIGNSASWPALLLACFRSGAVPLPLGRHIESNEREAALRSCQAQYLVECDGGEISSQELPQNSGTRFPFPEVHFLKLTSGTTAAPRAICFTADQLVADCDNICETMGIRGEDINFGVIPFSHSYGFSNMLTPLLCRGIPIVASEDRMPRAMLNDVARSGATVFAGMPVFFQAFGEMTDLPELPKLRLCISAGAPLTKNIGDQFTRNFGRKIHTFYGASECGGIGYDASDEPIYEDGFVGTPMKNVRIEERGDGGISVRSEAVGLGYFPSDDSDDLGAGCFKPSDLIHFDARGMYAVGRASHIINVAGRKLNPVEVEAQLRKFPGITAAVVFGVHSSLRHEEPIACLTVDGNFPGRPDLMRFCHSNLSAWQVPKDFWIVAEMPVTERGKLSHGDLARQYLAENPRKL